MGLCRRIIAFVLVVAGLFSVDFASPAMAHQNGCHAQHSCPSDASPPTYMCGDTGNYTYCPNLSGSAVVPGSSATIGSVLNGYVSWSVAVVTGTVVYQWYRSGVAIPGAAGSSYAVTAEDIGQPLVMTASATDGRGQNATASTSPVVPAYPPLPVGSAYVVQQAATVGTVVTATVSWSRPTVATYQWFRGETPIPGATAPAYTVTADDLGAPLKLVAIVTEYGRSTTVTSTTLTPMAAVTLTLSTRAAVRAGKKVAVRGSLETVGGAAARVVTVKAWQKVGRRWIVRKTVGVPVSDAGAFVLNQKTDRKRSGPWRFKAYFAGGLGVLAAESAYASVLTR